ncbi:MAG TPA: RNA polymerase sigma-70 factor [Bacteroidales bacterium]|nr:RNA polymerase sigma-70 factor [Bacteroidales bacterium]
MTTDSTIDRERALSSQIREGNKDAFRILYDLYSRKIYGFALNYLKSQSEAEEVVQVVFVKIWENRGDIRDDLSLQSYLYKVTINHIYNLFKFKRIRDIDENFVLAEKSDYSTLEKIQFDNLSENINKLIDQLPEQRRVIFKLSRMRGLSHDEIAKKLNISIRTVESQIYKALKFLKKHLGEELMLLLLISVA